MYIISFKSFLFLLLFLIFPFFFSLLHAWSSSVSSTNWRPERAALFCKCKYPRCSSSEPQCHANRPLNPLNVSMLQEKQSQVCTEDRQCEQLLQEPWSKEDAETHRCCRCKSTVRLDTALIAKASTVKDDHGDALVEACILLTNKSILTISLTNMRQIWENVHENNTELYESFRKPLVAEAIFWSTFTQKQVSHEVKEVRENSPVHKPWAVFAPVSFWLRFAHCLAISSPVRRVWQKVLTV